MPFKRDKNLGNFLVRSAFRCSNQPRTFTCKRTRCKSSSCPFISNTVKISGTKRSVKVADHFTCISTIVIYCITYTLCKKIYIGETGRRLADRFREHLRDGEKKKMRPNQSRAILIFPITPTTTWLFAGYPYSTGTQKAAKISNKNSFFNWVHSLHTELMNTSQSTFQENEIVLNVPRQR